jgi:hypothetical protein
MRYERSSKRIVGQTSGNGIRSTPRLLCATPELMRKSAAILLTVVLAMVVTPLRLPAASCILSNAPSQKACKMDCCANKTCCAVSEKNKGPGSQPLAQNAATKHQVIGLLVTLPVAFSALSIQREPVAPEALPVRAHSPPPLAASCIRLI